MVQSKPSARTKAVASDAVPEQADADIANADEDVTTYVCSCLAPSACFLCASVFTSHPPETLPRLVFFAETRWLSSNATAHVSYILYLPRLVRHAQFQAGSET